MFKIRSARISDLDQLFELSNLVFFINLPPDRNIIEKILLTSEKSFQSPSNQLWKNVYVFVLEEVETRKVIGVSLIHAQHGTVEEPHFYLKVSQEYKFSNTMNTGFIHGMLKLGLDCDGPTEIGGLVLHPDYRASGEKIGKFLSFARFMYMAIFPDRFKSIVHAELMPPLDHDGNSPLWEAVGRRFMNMNYYDADKLSRTNKEFILNLFPSENIYITLLPVEARNAIGKVGPDTLPVKQMLEKIGFRYTNEIDPFDGGPHYRCPLKEISVIKNMGKAICKVGPTHDLELEDFMIASVDKLNPFNCIKCKCHIDDNNNIILSEANLNALGLKEGSVVNYSKF